MNLNCISAVLPPCFSAGHNVGLLGQPGVGKTEFVRSFVATLRASQIRPELAEPGDDEKPVRFISVATTTKEAVDVSGCPAIRDGVTVWNPPAWVPSGNEAAVVFLDEFPQADIPTQLAFQKLIDRDLDGCDVSPRAVFVIAGNRIEDNAGANEIPQHLRNRFSWFTVECDAAQWCEWAQSHGVPQVVVEFIRSRPEMLNRFDAASDALSYATPRSVTRFGGKLGGMTNEAVIDALAAADCGAEWAAEFRQFRQLYAQMPDIDVVLQNPTTHPLPSDLGILLAFSSSLVAAAKADKSRSKAVVTVIDRMFDAGAQEVAAKTMRDVVASDPAIFASAEGVKLFAKIGPMMRV